MGSGGVLFIAAVVLLFIGSQVETIGGAFVIGAILSFIGGIAAVYKGLSD